MRAGPRAQKEGAGALPHPPAWCQPTRSRFAHINQPDAKTRFDWQCPPQGQPGAYVGQRQLSPIKASLMPSTGHPVVELRIGGQAPTMATEPAPMVSVPPRPDATCRLSLCPWKTPLGPDQPHPTPGSSFLVFQVLLGSPRCPGCCPFSSSVPARETASSTRAVLGSFSDGPWLWA